MAYRVYMLRCADGSYHTGSAKNLSQRIVEHEQGLVATRYTFRRRPVKLVWAEEVPTHNEALLHEHQIKGWTRVKKEALVRGDFSAVHEIVVRERHARKQKKRRSSY